ncbi:unnamed protein product [Leptidea sinapis]|uniref:Uncharacterized protein n=1 Tax=Leptidea sinapis TaxID=189913 RepID=A0A5E4R3Q4_9NEOP|nr:unnamed protein product [Leptidea sinapis]
MHYGCDGGDETNPALLRYYLDEIRSCNNTSKAGFFLIAITRVQQIHHTNHITMCFIGGDASSYQPVLPFEIAKETFEQLVQSESSDADLIRVCYKNHGETYKLEGDDKW